MKPRTRLRRKLVWGTANETGITSNEDSSVENHLVENYIALNGVRLIVLRYRRGCCFSNRYYQIYYQKLSFGSFRKLYNVLDLLLRYL